MENLHSTYGAMYAHHTEEIVSEIFKDMGYTVLREIRDDKPFDLLAEKDGVCYAIEVKAYRRIRINSGAIRNIAERVRDNLVHAYFMGKSIVFPAIVVMGIVDDGVSDVVKRFHPEFQLIDIRNLLYMVKGNELLRNKLVSLLPFTIDEVEPVKPELKLSITDTQESSDIWGNYIRRIDGWVPSEEENAEYETLCCDILENLFADDLTGWQRQQPSNNNLFRFDAIAKIKHGNKKEFWEMLERYFNSKYIIFEYKNYSQEITQAQVYTTVKYLYAKALRSVAILLSTNGADKHADIAIRGILRDEGKLIVALSNKDLVTMLKMKQRDEDPADFLSKRLDTLLIDLEK